MQDIEDFVGTDNSDQVEPELITLMKENNKHIKRTNRILLEILDEMNRQDIMYSSKETRQRIEDE